jgi:hypothetical protein
MIYKFPEHHFSHLARVLLLERVSRRYFLKQQTTTPMKNLIKSLVIATTLAAGTAYAVPNLSIIVTDGTTTDSFNTETLFGGSYLVSTGVVNLDGWSFSASAADSGSVMDLDSLDILNTGSGTLTLTVSAQNFLTNGGIATSTVGGNGSGTGTITVSSFGDASNVLFQKTKALGSIVLSNPGSPFSGSVTASSAGLNAPFSLTQVVAVANPSKNFTNSIDSAITTVPDSGTTLLLLGLGAVGVCVAARKFKSVRA